jgi:hypothetical protein
MSDNLSCCVTKSNEPKKRRINAVIRTEQQTGVRLCLKCDKMLPLDQFRTSSRYHLCIIHSREVNLYHVMGTHEKIAYNSLRCRARVDMVMFNQEKMYLPRKLVVAMLTKEQIENYKAYCIIPKRPDQPISKDNSVAVTSTQRRHVVDKWKVSRDADQYERDLIDVLALEPR